MLGILLFERLRVDAIEVRKFISKSIGMEIF
jgi:hypothetical protein